jgi:hypothetical protein
VDSPFSTVTFTREALAEKAIPENHVWRFTICAGGH